jgi:uncharacterized protein YxjI
MFQIVDDEGRIALQVDGEATKVDKLKANSILINELNVGEKIPQIDEKLNKTAEQLSAEITRSTNKDNELTELINTNIEDINKLEEITNGISRNGEAFVFDGSENRFVVTDEAGRIAFEVGRVCDPSSLRPPCPPGGLLRHLHGKEGGQV